MTEEAAQVMEKYQETQKLLSEAAEDLKAFTKEYEKLKKACAHLRSVEVDYVNQLDDLNRIIKVRLFERLACSSLLALLHVATKES